MWSEFKEVLEVFALGVLVGGTGVLTYHLWKARAWAEARKLAREAESKISGERRTGQ